MHEGPWWLKTKVIRWRHGFYHWGPTERRKASLRKPLYTVLGAWLRRGHFFWHRSYMEHKKQRNWFKRKVFFKRKEKLKAPNTHRHSMGRCRRISSSRSSCGNTLCVGRSNSVREECTPRHFQTLEGPILERWRSRSWERESRREEKGLQRNDDPQRISSLNSKFRAVADPKQQKNWTKGKLCI